MSMAQELQNGVYEQDVESDDDVMEEFFSDAFEFKGKQKYEQGFRRGFEQRRRSLIRDIILKNYRVMHGVDVPKALAEKLDAIDSYRALEEIQVEA